MSLFPTNRRTNILTLALVSLLFAGVAFSSDTDSSNTGPTVTLNYDPAKTVKVPSSSFMYFIPLIAPAHVVIDVSHDNSQKTWILSYNKKSSKNSFYVNCTFKMQGTGFFKTTLDHDEIIASFKDEIKKSAPIKNALDYINFQGDGVGRYEAWGTITNGKETVNLVKVHFDLGPASPVTIGLYSVDCVNGKYDYSKKYDQLVARAGTLTFKKDSADPKMEVAVTTVNNASDPNGFFGGLVGFFANFLIPPTRVSVAGNNTMLDFGYALFIQAPIYTFPKATNIRSAE